MQHNVIWKAKPSIFQNASVYLMTLIGLALLSRFSLYIHQYPYAAVTQFQWGQSLSAWEIKDLEMVLLAAIYITEIILLLYALIKLLQTLMCEYLIEDDQLLIRYLALNGKCEIRIEMYRIVDYFKDKTFMGMAFGFSDVKIRTTDRAYGDILISAIAKPSEFIEMAREVANRCRKEKNIQEFITPPPPASNND